MAIAPTVARADCTQALITSSYSRLNQSDANWQLAQLVTEETYNRVRQSAGGSASLFGISLDGDYAQFRASVQNRMRSTQSSWSQSDMENVLWTGLDPNASSAYIACLNASIFQGDGLQAAVVAATDTNVLIRVRWNVPGNSQPVNVTWSTPIIEGETLRTQFPQGSTIINVPRPAGALILAASYGGYTSQAIVLAPLPQLETTQTATGSLGRRIYEGERAYFIANPAHGSYMPAFEVRRITYDRVQRLWLSLQVNVAYGVYSFACDPVEEGGSTTYPFTPGPACPETNSTNRNSFVWASSRPASPLKGEVVVHPPMVSSFDEDGRVFDDSGLLVGILVVPPLTEEP